MNSKEFKARVEKEPALLSLFVKADHILVPPTRTGGMELLALGLIYPVVLYMFKNIGLPWLSVPVRLVDLELAKMHKWIDEKYKSQGLDPEKGKKAANEMWAELSEIKAPADQKLLEDLRRDMLADSNTSK
jgi:hypothetical protein